ncbi:MAG: UDP-glucose/GDP-mannose dehydrogenase family protein [Pyrinomonadaceae bacterium]|nr:UDP-glucose/GDP-mannose dehydrogenase family protein [Blastocatellia bacterium]MCW5957546.1 UDP-glucose/GDP-mannose dehydrogenase family protein [Pyrinomonadaceae bacterium]
MRISVFGLGYVGIVSAACLADDGHDVIGVDINDEKVDLVNTGKSPVVELGVSDLIREGVKNRKLRATVDVNEAVGLSDLSLVCVGTPSNENGSLKLDYVERVSQQIGEAIGQKKSKHIVVIRSTMLPGTIDRLVRPTLEEYSGKSSGVGFDVCINPEFLREGTSIKDFYSPPFTLIGSDDDQVSDLVQQIYAGINAPLYKTSIKAAEMVKYACNCFHGVKISFANEIGNLCKELGVDSHQVMEVFCKDTKLNLSPYYLIPGFAFGGSCLPKDLRALQYKAKELDVDVPLLRAVLDSNQLQIERAVRMVTRTRKKKIGVLGFAFKAGTDDLRESPVVSLVERLIGKGFDVLLYDREVSVAKLVGSNKEYIEGEIPHISRLMADTMKDVVDNSEVIVIGNNASEFGEIEKFISSEKVVIDLVRVFGEKRSEGKYEGICW